MWATAACFMGDDLSNEHQPGFSRSFYFLHLFLKKKLQKQKQTKKHTKKKPWDWSSDPNPYSVWGTPWETRRVAVNSLRFDHKKKLLKKRSQKGNITTFWEKFINMSEHEGVVWAADARFWRNNSSDGTKVHWGKQRRGNYNCIFFSWSLPKTNMSEEPPRVFGELVIPHLECWNMTNSHSNLANPLGTKEHYLPRGLL